MSAPASTTVLSNPEHLRDVTTKNIHLVRRPHDGDYVESAARAAADLLKYHVVSFDGRALRSDLDVVRAVCDGFDASEWVKQSPVLGWAQAEDAMWDLKDVFDPPYSRKGAVVVLREPEHLLQANLVGFIWLIDSLSAGAQFRIEQGFPLHMVIGPLPDDERYEALLGHLRIAEHFCEACRSSMCDD